MTEIIWSFLLLILGLIAIAWGLTVFARRQQAHARWLGKPRRATISWLGTYSEGFQRALDVLPQVGASILNADPNSGNILAGVDGSLRSFGTTVKVSLTTQEGVTFVTVEAGASAMFFDAGESSELIKRFLVLWERLPGPAAD